MPTQTGSLDLSSQKKAHDDAAKVATNYISTDSTGLMVADGDGSETPSTATTRNVFIDSDSVEIRDGTESRASFGELTRLGKKYVPGATDNENHAELDYRSLRLFDKRGGQYFSVEDLRDNSGVAQVVDTFKGDGNETIFALSLQAINADYSVVVSDSSGGNVTKRTYEIEFSSAPVNGSTITVTYQSTDDNLKAFTFGNRQSGSNTGGLSVAEGISIEASGAYSHAEGFYSAASGECAHAEGRESQAVGPNAHAEGAFTEAIGSMSHAQNMGTIAQHACQTAIGKYNIADTSSVLIIGNGLPFRRSNALTVDFKGNVEAAGEVKAGGSTPLVPIGTILDFAAATPPTGYLVCDGSAVSRTDYAALFAVIGTTWGAGDGSTTFNLPDFRGRTAIGAGTGTASDATAHALGDMDGSETHKLTEDETPVHAHTHSMTQPAFTLPNHVHETANSMVVYNNASSVSTRMATSGSGTKISLNNALANNLNTYNPTTNPACTRSTNAAVNARVYPSGESESTVDAHNVMQPYATVTKIIRAV